MAVTEISSAERMYRYRVIGCAALITGLLTAPAQSLVDNLNLLRGLGGLSMAVSGIPFAILVVAISRTLVHAEWWRALSLGFAVVVAFEIAIIVASETSLSLTSWPEPLRNVVGGLEGGFLGAALMAGGAVLLHVGPGRLAPFLPMIAAGTVLGVILTFDVWRQADNFWVLFPVWQVAVALLFARALERTPKS